MAIDPYDEILKRARNELTAEERQRLVQELAASTGTFNGGADGRTLYDALDSRGLIGFMTDGPGDLSTDPKHMEGFGNDAE